MFFSFFFLFLSLFLSRNIIERVSDLEREGGREGGKEREREKKIDSCDRARRSFRFERIFPADRALLSLTKDNKSRDRVRPLSLLKVSLLKRSEKRDVETAGSNLRLHTRNFTLVF